MPDSNGKKYITWKALVLTLIPLSVIIFIALLSASWTLAGTNASKEHAHKDLVKYREIELIHKNIGKMQISLDRIDKRLDDQAKTK